MSDTTPDATAPPAPEPTDEQLPGIAPEPEPADAAPDKPKRQRAPRTRKPKPDAEPKPNPASSTPKRGRPSNLAKLEKDLAGMIAVAFGLGSAALAGPQGVGAPGTFSRDCELVAAQAEPLAAALVHVAERNPKVRALLESAVSSGAYGELLTVVLGGIALPIMANHQLLPGPIGAIYGQQPPAAPLHVVSDAPTP